MPWASFGAVEPYSIPNDMSAGGLAVMAVVIVISLGFLLIPVTLAGRAPRHRTPTSNASWVGTVQGGMHVGEGRSVAPHRDAEAEPASAAQAARDAEAQAAREDEAAAAQSRESGGDRG
jgi:hypothetical protein